MIAYYHIYLEIPFFAVNHVSITYQMLFWKNWSIIDCNGIWKNINYIIPIKVDSGKIETLWNNV
jgi:hypothetical protein